MTRWRRILAWWRRQSTKPPVPTTACWPRYTTADAVRLSTVR